MDVYRIEDFKGGWFIGNFEPALVRTPQFEVGWKIHTPEEGVVPHIHRQITEYNLVTGGRMNVNGRDLAAGDVFVLHPGERVDVEVLTPEVHVVCVKIPSIPQDKEICAPS